MDNGTDPRLSRIAIYPIKSLDPVEREREAIDHGALQSDREFAIRDEDERYVNGKRTAEIHRLRASFEEYLGHVLVWEEGTDHGERFSLNGDREPLETWLGDFFGYPVTVDRERAGGFPDDTSASGPTVISTATIEEVASWFPGIGVEGMRRRLRANLEIEGVPPFWEDRLYGDRESVVTFQVGAVEFRGTNPCQRCVVPSRDPRTGAEYEGFNRTFVERREETLPPWANEAWFDHHFRLMVNTRVPESEWGSEIVVGDEVRIGRERPLGSTESG